MFVRCVFIFALQNITLGGCLDTRRNIYVEHIFRNDSGREIYIP